MTLHNDIKLFGDTIRAASHHTGLKDEFIEKEKFNLLPFEINVLNKEQTLKEKLVSLIRFSFAENAVESISQKIRHFYDLYFLMNDADCASYIQFPKFKSRLLKF